MPADVKMPDLEGALFVVGEHIPAGASIRVGEDLKLYVLRVAPPYIATAGADLREGFRACLRPDGQVYEDDA